ncbi:DUF4259 domain-containing protein [bacterium]|nr:DUF4259 domain-containing protein [bacterium]
MGRWDTGVFDSDSVLDWVGDLCDSGLAKGIAETIVNLEKGLADGYMEMDDCEISVALAQIVAILHGKPRPRDLPEELADLLDSDRHRSSRNELGRSLHFLEKALGGNAEINEDGVWDSPESLAAWRSHGLTLQKYLKSLQESESPKRGCLWF